MELWQKGLIWDSVLGYKLIQVDQLFQGQLAAVSLHNGSGGFVSAPPPKFHAKRWFTLDADLLVSGLDQPTIIGTKNSTPYMVLLDLRWELTVDPMIASGGGGGLIMDHHQTFEPSCRVDNYNKIDTYGSITEAAYGNCGGGAYDVPDYPRQQYNSEMYSTASVYNGLIDEDALYNRLDDDDNKSYLMGNCKWIIFRGQTRLRTCSLTYLYILYLNLCSLWRRRRC